MFIWKSNLNHQTTDDSLDNVICTTNSKTILICYVSHQQIQTNQQQWQKCKEKKLQCKIVGQMYKRMGKKRACTSALMHELIHNDPLSLSFSLSHTHTQTHIHTHTHTHTHDSSYKLSLPKRKSLRFIASSRSSLELFLQILDDGGCVSTFGLQDQVFFVTHSTLLS